MIQLKEKCLFADIYVLLVFLQNHVNDPKEDLLVSDKTKMGEKINL